MLRKKHGRGRHRLLAAYLVVVLAVAVTGPGLSVYGAEDEVVPEAAPVGEQVAPETPVATEPAVEPVPEAPASPEPPLTEVAPEEAVAAPEAAPALPQPAIETAVTEDVPPESGPAFPALTEGGVRIFGPGTGTYSAGTVDAKCEPVPDGFVLTLQVYNTAEGTFLSFTSSHPIAKVVVCGGEAGSNIYWLGGATAGSWLHAPAVDGTFVTPCAVDFYFCDEAEGGCLDVYKFEDDDRDGRHDEGEDMLEGVQFLLFDAQGNRVGSGRTNSAGRLCFRGLAEGTYTAEEVLGEGWENTTPLRQCTLVCPGETSTLCFGNVRVVEAPETGILSVYIFHDLNRDGVRQSAEPLLNGWECSIRDDDGQDIDDFAPASHQNTRYELPAGVYSLSQPLQTGWEATTVMQRTATVVNGQETTVWFGVAQVSVTPPAPTTADSPFLPFTESDPPFLPFTGAESMLLIGCGIASSLGGAALRLRRRAA